MAGAFIKGVGEGALDAAKGLIQLTVPAQGIKRVSEIKQAITDWDGYVKSEKQKTKATVDFVKENFQINSPSLFKPLITLSNKGKQKIATAGQNEYDGLKKTIYNDPSKALEIAGKIDFEIGSMFIGVGEIAALSKATKVTKVVDKIGDASKVVKEVAEAVGKKAAKEVAEDVVVKVTTNKVGKEIVEGGAGVKPYSNIPDGSKVGSAKSFTKVQKDKIILQNMETNGGVIKSDLSGEILVKPQKSTSGVTPDPMEWQIDHIDPKSKGGSNSFTNAQVLSRQENRIKSNK